MKLLLDHGALPAGANALKHILDREDLEGLQLLLNLGADPNEVGPGRRNGASTGLSGVAVAQRRSPCYIDSGAALDTRRNDGRTAYSLAAIGGHTEIAALLEARGANTELSSLDRFLSRRACIRQSRGTREPAGGGDGYRIVAGQRAVASRSRKQPSHRRRARLAGSRPAGGRSRWRRRHGSALGLLERLCGPCEAAARSGRVIDNRRQSIPRTAAGMVRPRFALL